MAPKKSKLPFSEALIQEVQAYASIWDTRSKHHKDVVINGNAWSNILANMRATFSEGSLEEHRLNSEENLKSSWRNLRDTYRRMKLNSRGKSGSGCKKKTEWPFFQMLRFLDQSGVNEFENGGASSYVDLPEDDDQASGDDFSMTMDNDLLPEDGLSRSPSPSFSELPEENLRRSTPAGNY